MHWFLFCCCCFLLTEKIVLRWAVALSQVNWKFSHWLYSVAQFSIYLVCAYVWEIKKEVNTFVWKVKLSKMVILWLCSDYWEISVLGCRILGRICFPKAIHFCLNTQWGQGAGYSGPHAVLVLATDSVTFPKYVGSVLSFPIYKMHKMYSCPREVVCY